ncbi:MAG: TVP38/TMEM64 family protein [Variibacter sp.]|nr:TVP38/TMEM64 family protein [Variibacter sp.]
MDEPAGSAVAGPSACSLRRLWPLAVLAVLSGLALVMGWHRPLSFEQLVHHHETLQRLLTAHAPAALVGYVALYVAAVALSLPVGLYLTLLGGVLFGTVLGGAAAAIAATGGAICVFLIARSALGDHLVRKAGPLAEKLARGFRDDAFNYLLFLRLVPLFPFWLVNLVPAVCGVGLRTFALATALGVLPATFVFAFVGDGLDSVIAVQQDLYRACLAAGETDCRLEFHPQAALTPKLVAALVALGLLALLPVVVKRMRTQLGERSTG